MSNPLTAWMARRRNDAPDKMGDELDSIVLETTSSVLLWLSALYPLLAIGHYNILPPEQGVIMVPIACISGLFALVMHWQFGKYNVTSRYAYIVAYTTYFLALLNSAAQMWATDDIDQSTNFALIFIGIGLFFLAKRYLAMTYAITFIVWSVIVLNIEDVENERVHFFIMILLAMLIGLLAHSLHLKNTKRLINLRSEATVREDQLAVALNQARLYAEAEKENKAKTEFLTNMSHELRTPLNAILGFSEIMQREMFGVHSNPQYKEYSNHIHTAGDHLLSLVNDILDLSRIQLNEQDLQIQAVQLHRICTNCITIVRQHAERKNIKLTFNVPNDMPEIMIDGRRLKQILTNLLNNAVKFTPVGGTIHLDVTTEKDSQICFSVTDSGIGMSEEEVANATKPFWQAQTGLDRNFEGTGLGLALVCELLSLMKGKLVLNSQVNKGTQAIVYLPLQIAPEATSFVAAE
tara:strand:+ start:2478 stop:3869 length:1392 start_codon:yes stop_codon:yes gene_type:complete